MKTTMEYKGFKAEIMEAPRLIGDHVFELPKGQALPVYYADEFINYPENWMKGQGVFVVPVRPEKGLWFNWRMNDELNTAVLPTVKGANPVTGLQTSGFHLESYENKCPKHNCDFMADRFCPECDFKWPDRNFISQAPLWWDGFRADDGTVRQFFFSEEELRDVATHMIGKENTVPAFGFAFYTPKEKRQQPVTAGGARGMSMSGQIFLSSTPPMGSMKGITNDSFITANNSGDVNLYQTSVDNKNENYTNTGSWFPQDGEGEKELGASYSDDVSKGVECPDGGPVACAGGPISAAPVGGDAFVEDSGEKTGGIILPDSVSLQERLKHHKKMKKTSFIFEGEKLSAKVEPRGQQVNSTPRRPKPVKEVSIGAGAKIRQELSHDSYPLDSWKEVPDASMTIYFVFEGKLEELKSKGMRDIVGTPEGMLKNIPVG